MTIEWTILHPDRLVTAKGRGVTNLGHVEAFLDALNVAEALDYRKLVDFSDTVVEATDHDVLMLGARMRAYMTTIEGDALAFVVSATDTENYIRRYLNLAALTRPVRIFEDAAAARAWLDEPRKTGMKRAGF